jgi:triacylglycerol lipase
MKLAAFALCFSIGCATEPADDSVDCDDDGHCDAAAPLFPEPSLTPARFPILLAHGFNTSTTNFWAFNGVDTDLAEAGYIAKLGSVPPFDTPEVRAGFLSDQLDALLAETGAEKVNLVCFSMGGLDCRFLASPHGLNRGDVIASITTISSPHRGSGIADETLKFLPTGAAPTKVVDALATMFGKTFSEVADDSHLVAALASMAESNIGAFNERIDDAKGVFYQSFAGYSHVGGATLPGIEASIDDVCRDDAGTPQIFRHSGRRDVMDPLLVASGAFVGHFDALHPSQALPNDGVSTVASSKWGTFRGCYPADHLDQVGQIKDKPVDPRTGFAYLRLYRFIASDLAERGF